MLARRLTAGALIVFLVLTLTIAASIGQFTRAVDRTAGSAGRDAAPLRDPGHAPESSTRPTPPPCRAIPGGIAFEHVSFAYRPARTAAAAVLHEIDLEVQPGEVLALVGPSGAGKTTLFNLIPRFYDPTGGRMLIDGHDLRDVTLDEPARPDRHRAAGDHAVRRHGAREHPLRPAGRHRGGADRGRARRERARVHLQLPQGYDTLVGERGVKLCGGQRQRIAIARAILKDPRILMLDEATSALDSESEGLVQEALERLMQGRTTRRSSRTGCRTIQRAHRIAVLEAGGWSSWARTTS